MVEPSKTLTLVFDKAINDAKALKHEYVTVEHLLFAMLCEENFENVVKGAGIDYDFLKSNLEHHLKNNCDELKIEATKYKPKKTQSVERVLNRAFTQVLFNGRNYIELPDVFISMMSESKSVSHYYISKAGAEKEKFAEYINGETQDTYMDEEYAGAAAKALRQFTTNLNKEVESNRVDPVIGRSEELDSIALSLGRRSKNNVLCIISR